MRNFNSLLCLWLCLLNPCFGQHGQQQLLISQAIASGGGSSPAVVQHVLCNTNPATTTTTCAFGSSVTAGHMEVAFIIDNCGAGTDISTVVGSSGGSFTDQSPASGFNSNGSLCMRSFYKNSVTGGAETITFTWSASGAVDVGIEIFEISGQSASSPIDNGGAACSGMGSTAGTSWATSSCTVTSTDLLIGFAWQDNNLVTTAAGSGFTSLDAIGAATTNGSGVAESKASVSSSQTITATSSNSTNAWEIVGFAIK